MSYRKIFDLALEDNPENLVGRVENPSQACDYGVGDRRDGMVYLYTEEIVMVLNVALATGRPLLIRGPSGSGKSSLAYNVARMWGARYYEFVVTSRSRSRDLLWSFDAVRRLGDAQAHGAKGGDAPSWQDHYPYVQPGVLWWIFDRDSAARRGWESKEEPPFEVAKDLAEYQPTKPETTRSVLLVDEIDKADPDFANNLLVPFGSYKFRVDETQTVVRLKKPEEEENSWEYTPLLIITTNDERGLPDAFLRRCLVFEMDLPDKAHMLEIARISEGPDQKFYGGLFDQIMKFQNQKPSIPQFLDAVRACQRLKKAGSGAEPDRVLDMILSAILKKDS